MPYRTSLGQTYDSGDFPAILETACEASGWHAARGQSPGAGGQAGRSSCAASGSRSTSIPAAPTATSGWHSASMRKAGRPCSSGASRRGRGTRRPTPRSSPIISAFPQSHVRVRQGDTDLIAHGSGSSGSRSPPRPGATRCFVRRRKPRSEGRAVAAALLESRVDDVQFFEAGRYRIAGTDRSAGFADVVRASFDPALRPESRDSRSGRRGQSHGARRDLRQRLPRVRGGDRTRDGRRAHRPLHRRRRFRSDPQSAPGGGAGPRRRRAGDRPGALRACGV